MNGPLVLIKESQKVCILLRVIVNSMKRGKDKINSSRIDWAFKKKAGMWKSDSKT